MHIPTYPSTYLRTRIHLPSYLPTYRLVKRLKTLPPSVVAASNSTSNKGGVGEKKEKAKDKEEGDGSSMLLVDALIQDIARLERQAQVCMYIPTYLPSTYIPDLSTYLPILLVLIDLLIYLTYVSIYLPTYPPKRH